MIEQTPLNEAKLPNKNTFFTIDPFVSVASYNEALQALENNKIDYTEYISLYKNRNWYLSLENNQRPIMINYTEMDSTEWTKVVSKTKPLKTNHIYLLYRRSEKSDIGRYVENDWLKIAKKSTSVVFKIDNKEELFRLSKVYGKIYPLGVYFSNSMRLAICFNPGIKNALPPTRILLEKGPHKTGELELAINYKVLRNQDKIVKYMETPYWSQGKFYQTSPVSPLKIL
jgi:hypothetical protein